MVSDRAMAGIQRPVRLREVEQAEQQRMRTGLDEFDFVLGGGVVPGSVVLLGGAPGIGKSTILTQVAARLDHAGCRILYVSGEESAHQVKLRATRIGGGAEDIAFLAETEVGHLIARAREFDPAVLVVDSIQTLYAEEMEGAPGNVGQIRECAARIQRYAKDHGVAVFMVGHVTKDGSLAGPRILEHIVDTTIYFEHTGDQEHRIMRAVKNRFGSVDEIGVFRMTEHGLETVANPSELFLADRSRGATGSAVTALIEGTRPVLVEIQGLVGGPAYGSPQRVSTGYSRKRLAILLAVLEKRAGLPFGQYDVFVNVVGGLELAETAADATVVAALASSAVNRPLPEDAIFLGEVGLGGEVRRVGQPDRRIAEAAQLGFRRVYLAKKSVPRSVPAGVRVIGVENVGELIREALGEFRMPSTRPDAPRSESRRASAERSTNELRRTGRHRIAVAVPTE